MLDIGNKGADKSQVFNVLFHEKPVMDVESDTVGIFLEKEFTVL